MANITWLLSFEHSEAAGIVFLDGTYSGSGGSGVRLTAPSGSMVDTDESETISIPWNSSKATAGQGVVGKS